MTVVVAIVVLALVVFLLVRGRRRRSAGTADAARSPWDALDEGIDPTEPG